MIHRFMIMDYYQRLIHMDISNKNLLFNLDLKTFIFQQNILRMHIQILNGHDEAYCKNIQYITIIYCSLYI